MGEYSWNLFKAAGLWITRGTLVAQNFIKTLCAFVCYCLLGVNVLVYLPPPAHVIADKP